MFGITLKLLNLAGYFVDVGEQSARRFAIETRRRNERVMPLLPLRPRTRIELGPIIPALLWRERRQMTPTRPRVESFGLKFSFCAQVRYVQ
jgi:hypothetical protein